MWNDPALFWIRKIQDWEHIWEALNIRVDWNEDIWTIATDRLRMETLPNCLKGPPRAKWSVSCLKDRIYAIMMLRSDVAKITRWSNSNCWLQSWRSQSDMVNCELWLQSWLSRSDMVKLVRILKVWSSTKSWIIRTYAKWYFLCSWQVWHKNISFFHFTNWVNIFFKAKYKWFRFICFCAFNCLLFFSAK